MSDRSRASLRRTGSALCSCLLLPVVLPAQDPAAAQAASADAGMSVQPAPAASTRTSATPVRTARLSFFAGSVEIGRVDNTAAGEPVPNMPLVEGTRIITGDYGQAEIEFEDGSVARLTPRTVLTLNQLSVSNGAARTELGLLAGLAYFELRQSRLATYTVDAGGTRLTPLENLTVRISLDNPPAVFAVLTGSARVERPGDFTAEVHAGESLRGIPDGAKPYYRTDLIVPETWDFWNVQRDQGAADEADQRTAAREPFAGDQGYGWSDLDNHGTWYSVPGAGPSPELVWQPENADAGFDPYGFGNWVYINTNYVWASGYSWGWTPFHCGAWQYFGGFGWGWSPNDFCGRWGFGGNFGGIFLGHHPGRFPPVLHPQPGPVHPKPIIPVRGPDGPRPAFQRGSEARIAGRVVIPLPVTGTRFPRSESPIGQSLRRDFPVDPGNRQPVLGLTSSQPAHRTAIFNGTLPLHAPPSGRPPFAPGTPPGTLSTPARPYLPTTAPRPITSAAPIRSTPSPPPMRPPSAPPSSSSRPKAD